MANHRVSCLPHWVIFSEPDLGTSLCKTLTLVGLHSGSWVSSLRLYAEVNPVRAFNPTTVTAKHYQLLPEYCPPEVDASGTEEKLKLSDIGLVL